MIESFDFGVESTESTLKTLGPKSVNSTCSLFSIFGDALAWETNADTPSAPNERAPPTATYLPAPLSAFENLSLLEPFGEGLLNHLFIFGNILMFESWLGGSS